MTMKKRYLLVFVSAIILIALVYYSDPKKVYDIFSGSDKLFIFYALLLSSVSVVLRVMKWKVLLTGVSFLDVAPVQLLGITISNFTPAKVGEPTKSLLMKMKTGIPVSRSLSSIIWERIIDIVVLILFSIMFIRYFSSSFYFLEIASILVFVTVIVVFLAMLYKKSFGIKIFGFLKSLPIMNRVSDQFLETFYKEKISKMRLLISLFITMLVWLIDGYVFYLSFRSVGVVIDPVFFVGLFAVSTLIGVASFLPGGLGSTDAVMVLLLSPAMGPSLAVTGVFIARVITFWYFVFLGFISFIYLGRYFDVRKVFD